MATPVIMPRQGQSVESCIFSEWHIKPGSEVKRGDLLFSYETDKAAFEGEAPDDGILLGTFAEPGDEVPVLQNIAVIGNEGEDIEPFRPGKQVEEEETGILHGPELAASTNQKEERIEKVEKLIPGQLRISPRARKASQKYQVSFEGMKGSGPYGRILEKDIVEKFKKTPRATPLARSISFRDHLDMPAQGSGAGGKITASDLKKKTGVIISEDYEEIRISNIRKIIAENMHASLRNTAQLTLHTSADARKIKSARKKFKEKMEQSGGPNITLNDIVSFALIRALLKHPDMNAHFMGDSVRQYRDIHLGFAVDTKRGLMVPTIFNANHLTLEELSMEMKELASRAQESSIDPELLRGATFTATNLGSFDIEIFTPVLNPPQVGILGINTITLQPAMLNEGTFGFIPKIGLSLTFDHRAIDGAPAAAFLKEVKNQIEIFESV
jgi:pyruvate dehydrogenase E2 component (dihydrolipoamide acetyltransferase)